MRRFVEARVATPLLELRSGMAGRGNWLEKTVKSDLLPSRKGQFQPGHLLSNI